ncbi:unnamed protein product [Closterium sp. NIES-54]
MRKKLDTRFPAARIKKIMQADEEVGKIALATPVLISKALEIFLQDLCDRTYDITCKRGAKTLAASHLKQCVASFSEYDFLKEVVSKLPDVDAPDSPDDAPSGPSKRKLSDDDQEDLVSPKFKESKGTNRGRSNGCNEVVKAEVKLKNVNPLSSARAEGPSGFGQALRKREADDLSKPTKRSKALSDQPRPFKVLCKVKIPKRNDYDAEETPTAIPELKVEHVQADKAEARPVKREFDSNAEQVKAVASPRGFDLNFDLNAEPPEDAVCNKDHCTNGQHPGESISNEDEPHGANCQEKPSAVDSGPREKAVVNAPVLRNCVNYDSEDDYDCDDGA